MPQNHPRRRFLGASVAALAGGCLGGRCRGEAAENNRASQATRTLHEPARDVPVIERADVVVCGAGPAGIAAAVAAARQGARVRLLEVHGCLGGVWTAGLLSWILDYSNKPGIMREIVTRLDRADATARFDPVGSHALGYRPEAMKLVLEQMCLEASVDVRLFTRMTAAAVDDAGRLTHVVTESKSGREAWAGDVFIDCTGDGDLAARAGCGFDYGHPEIGETQPMSLIALLVGLEPEKVAPMVRGLAEAQGERSPKSRLLAEMRRAGVDPSYSAPTLFYLRQGLFCLMANHEYGVRADDAEAITEATLRARGEVHRLVNALAELGEPWSDIQIVATGEQIGVREGRRIHGLYTVDTADLIEGTRHEDAVCRVTFPIDIHSTDPRKTKGIQRESFRARPYDIPFRSLLAKDVDGLLMAGRCISGDFVAHSSYRVTGNAVAMGEAAGVAAALAAKRGCLPQELAWKEIAQGREALAQEI